MSRVLPLAALAALLLAAPAAAQRSAGVHDLEPAAAFAIRGLPTAQAVTSVGDVNGDARADAAISTGESEIRVVLAGDDVPGIRGFRIRGADLGSFDVAAAGAQAAGDVNGDGLADILVPVDGSTAVVFGRRAPRDIDLRRPEERDLLIDDDAYEVSVVGVGDVNGDGFGDLFVPSDEDSGDDATRRRATIVFGGADLRGRVDPERPGSRGFLLLARRGEILSSAAPAGDVDGDGVGDLVTASPITIPGEEPRTEESARRMFHGAAYVVYGRRGRGVIDFGSPTGGVTRTTARDATYLGYALAGPGDVNGDGLADVAIGAPLQDGTADRGGTAYVLFGDRSRPREVDLGGLGSRGLVIQGGTPSGGAGYALAPAGDVDGDGFRDLLVGEPSSEGLPFLLRPDTGSAHLVYGGRAAETVRLGGSDRALTLRGSGVDRVGISNAGDVDLDADGRRELLVARPGTCRVGRLDEGDVVAVEPGAPPGPRAAGVGGDGPDSLSGGPVGDRLSGLGGPDDLRGRDGHDCIAGGDDADRVRGGLSGDALFGEGGADAIFGDSGCDRIFGGEGADVIVAGPSKVPLAAALRAPIGARDRDDVEAGAGDDRVTSGADRDRLEGGSGNDRLSSGAADDRLGGGIGDDRLDGASGSDELRGEGGADVLQGGSGRDHLLGDSGDSGDDGDSPFLAILGDDSAATRPGADRLAGGAGDDHLDGGEGRDTLRGGAGRDRVVAVDRSRDVVDCGPGRDTAFVDRRDRVRGCERVRRSNR